MYNIGKSNLKYLNDLNTVKLLENVRQTKEYIEDKFSKGKYDKTKAYNTLETLKELLKKNPNLIFNFFKYVTEEGVLLNKKSNDENRGESVEAFIDWLKKNKATVKLLPKNILQYESFEELNDDITKTIEKVNSKYFWDMVKYLFIDFTYINNNASKVDELAKSYGKLDKAKRKKYEKKIKYFKINNVNIREFLSDVESYIVRGSSRQDVDEIIAKYSDDISIEYDKNDVLMVQTEHREAVRELGSTSWCIQYSDSFFTDYCSFTTFNTQYMVFNFNLPSTNRYSKFGITVNTKNEVEYGGHQDNDNIEISLEEISERTGIPIEQFKSKKTDFNKVIKSLDKKSQGYLKENAKDILTGLIKSFYDVDGIVEYLEYFYSKYSETTMVNWDYDIFDDEFDYEDTDRINSYFEIASEIGINIGDSDVLMIFGYKSGKVSDKELSNVLGLEYDDELECFIYAVDDLENMNYLYKDNPFNDDVFIFSEPRHYEWLDSKSYYDDINTDIIMKIAIILKSGDISELDEYKNTIDEYQKNIKDLYKDYSYPELSDELDKLNDNFEQNNSTKVKEIKDICEEILEEKEDYESVDEIRISFSIALSDADLSAERSLYTENNIENLPEYFDYRNGKRYIYQNDKINFFIDIDILINEVMKDFGDFIQRYELSFGDIEAFYLENYDLPGTEYPDNYSIDYKQFRYSLSERLYDDFSYLFKHKESTNENKNTKMKHIKLFETFTTFNSGNTGKTTTYLEHKEYELTSDIKGAKLSSKSNFEFNDITLLKGTIVKNLPGGVFVNHPELKKKYDSGYGDPQWKDGYGFGLKNTPSTLKTIEKNSKVLK